MTSLSGGNSEREPPDPISNSEVKTLSADDSMGSPHVKVGHCQAFKQTTQPCAGFFLNYGFLQNSLYQWLFRFGEAKKDVDALITY